jgi:16S rRNA (adenine(1408)-N(1))-methyltransferase
MRKTLSDSSLRSGEGIVIDIGTGDGRFVYQSARENPRRFYIGIDANPSPLAKISEKIHRKPAKGGAPNILFLQAAVEDLPPELDGIADEVHVHFPWGSLLRAVAKGDEVVLRDLRRLCADSGLLEVIIGFDPKQDQFELERLELSELSVDYLKTELVPRYQSNGFAVEECGILSPSSWPELKSSWARRLRANAGRVLIYLIARAVTLCIDQPDGIR